MQVKKRYDFRKELLKVHKDNIRDYSIKAFNDDFVLKDGAIVAVGKNSTALIKTAAKDFIDFLFCSLGVTAGLSNSEQGTISFEILSCSGAIGAKRMEYFIDIGDAVKISAYHERGIAQALYRLEQILSTRKAPFLKKQKLQATALFSPRMVHSAYGLDMFPDQYLSHLAHSGIDAVLVCLRGVDKVPSGYMDFNELCHRASVYGIDVYAYSHLKSIVHPDDEGAEEFYENLYGSVFKSCPALAGVVLVGESVLFPSRDQSTNGKYEFTSQPHEIPSSKPNPGWWPCKDYPQLVERIRDSVRKYSPSADIVFWTYNWGYAPEKERIELINNLPTDISLLVTFEMFEKYSMENIDGYCADYTLSFAGPGKYFLSEAKAAKARGLKLYAMSNTAGKTWDFGSVPYLPMPYQWIERYKGLIKSNEDFGLCGLMESHTFGLYPSFISQLSNAVYSMPKANAEELLTEIIIRNFGLENTEVLKKALHLFSQAITYYTPSNEDQYGAFRIGPAYPFCFTKKFMPKAEENAMYGSSIVIPDYDFPYLDFSPPPSLRTGDEISFLTKMSGLMSQGIALIEKLSISPNSELAKLLNLSRYMLLTIKTGINAKKWNMLKTEIRCEKDKESILVLLEKCKKLLLEEIENSKAAIPLVLKDSTFGYEPSMGYLGDAEHIEWKIKQVEYVLNTELKQFENRLFF